MTSRNLQAWAVIPTVSQTPLETAMETLLQLARTLAVEPSEAVHEAVQQRLAYGVERLTARLEEPAPEDEKPQVAAIRQLRNEGLQAYLTGHDELLLAGDDLLAATERARNCFDQGSALLSMAQSEVEDLLELYPFTH